MSMTTELLAKMGRKPLYAALEKWLVEYYPEFDDALSKTAQESNNPEIYQDMLNICSAIYDIVYAELVAVGQAEDEIKYPVSQALGISVEEIEKDNPF